MTISDRTDFRDWIDEQPEPDWQLMPLMHVTKAFTARDVIREGKITPSEAGPLKVPLAYFFYGRPAFRVSGDGAIKVGATCPVCFVFDPDIIKRAHSMHAFDTGAFGKRLYSHVMLDEMNVGDFALGSDWTRPNKLIGAAFGSQEAYFEGNLSKAATPSTAPIWNFLAQAYLQLLTSPGRNEPDDRIGGIEVTFADPVLLADNLRAVIVPHILWNDKERAPWLDELRIERVEILPYKFIPGKSADFYYGLIENEVRSILTDLGII